MTEVINATFDTESKEGQFRVFNAQNGSAKSMKDMGDDVVTVTDILVYKDEIDQYGKLQEAEITTIYTEDGELYASISSTVGKSAKGLIEFFKGGLIDKVDVKVVKAMSKNGQEFLNLKALL